MAQLVPWMTSALVGLAALVAALVAAATANGGSAGLHPRPQVRSPACRCEDDKFGLDEGVARCQLASDFLIALAYFSIPLELVYFFLRAKVLPHRDILLQFGLFIVLCGMTHLVNIWTYGPHSEVLALTQTVLKALTAGVSCATAILLYRVIPLLLTVKVRELFLAHKTASLDAEMGDIRRSEAVRRNVRSITQEIRASLDRHTIMHTTLSHLAHALSLTNCTLWMPQEGGSYLELTHELIRRLVQETVRVSAMDDTVEAVLCTEDLVDISNSSVLAQTSMPRGPGNFRTSALRIPVETVPRTEACDIQYAIMVMVLPLQHGRSWKVQDVEIVQTVADQVAVALSHAAVLEHSQKVIEALKESNQDLQIARHKAGVAAKAREDLMTVIDHEMRIPLHSVMAATSLLQESRLDPGQVSMVNTILCSSSLISTAARDVLQLSRLCDTFVEVETHPFELEPALDAVRMLVWPFAHSQGVSFSLTLAETLPHWVVGDRERLLQATINILHFSLMHTPPRGSVAMTVQVDNMDSSGESGSSSWEPVSVERHMYLRVEIRDTGRGFTQAELSSKAYVSDLRTVLTRGLTKYTATDTGLAIAAMLVQGMGGQLSVCSSGVGKGCELSFHVRLQQDLLLRRQEDQGPIADTFESELGGLRVIVVDDDISNLKLNEMMLSALGCDVTAVSSSAECLFQLGALSSMPFDAILLDVCLPDCDGFELSQRVKHMFRSEDRPLMIALTARADRAVQQACNHVGMDLVLLKPISIRELGVALAEVVQTARI